MMYHNDILDCILNVGLFVDSIVEYNAFVIALLLALPRVFGCVFNFDYLFAFQNDRRFVCLVVG